METQLLSELGAGVRVCRKCGAQYIGHSALCETHTRELAAQQAQEIAQALRDNTPQDFALGFDWN